MTTVVAVFGLASCAGPAQSADVVKTREARSAEASASGIRQDRDPVRKRFPQFGDFKSVVWEGEVLGEGKSTVPGPSDVRMSGVVWLADADAERLKEDYSWRDEPGRPVVLSAVRPRVPESARWQTSEEFTSTVTRERYSAMFYVDFEQKVIVFDAINPEVKGT